MTGSRDERVRDIILFSRVISCSLKDPWGYTSSPIKCRHRVRAKKLFYWRLLKGYAINRAGRLYRDGGATRFILVLHVVGYFLHLRRNDLRVHRDLGLLGVLGPRHVDLRSCLLLPLLGPRLGPLELQPDWGGLMNDCSELGQVREDNLPVVVFYSFTWVGTELGSHDFAPVLLVSFFFGKDIVVQPLTRRFSIGG